MLYKFKSKNAGDVIMLEANGRKVLEVIGKDAGPTGIVLAEQIPAAIQALQDAIALEESTQQAVDAEPDAVYGDAPGMRQRAMPFIDMLKRNHKAGTDVTWGV
jgi:hypothetical protein